MHILVMATAEAQYEVQNFELHKSRAEQKSSYEKYQKRNKPDYSFSFKEKDTRQRRTPGLSVRRVRVRSISIESSQYACSSPLSPQQPVNYPQPHNPPPLSLSLRTRLPFLSCIAVVLLRLKSRAARPPRARRPTSKELHKRRCYQGSATSRASREAREDYAAP
jgi:hypothetical protein